MPDFKKSEHSTVENVPARRSEMPSKNSLSTSKSSWRNLSLCGVINVKSGMSFQEPLSEETILHIVDELDPLEVERILFVCRDFACHMPVHELLKELHEKNILKPTGLVELLFVVERFDLLKKYLQMSKTDASQLLKSHPRLLSDYRVLMVEFHEELTDSDLDSLIFLLKPHMKSGGKLQKKTFLSLIIELEKMNLVAPDNLKLLDEKFQTINRIDLRSKLLKCIQAGCEVSRGPYINAFGVRSAIHKLKPLAEHSLKNELMPKSGIHFLSGVPVQETGQCIQEEVNDDEYVLHPKNGRYCLIIDCVGNDADLLEVTFKSLNFTVQKHMYCTTRYVEEVLQDMTTMDQLQQQDIFVCILISRGSSNCIFGTDQRYPGISLDKIRNYFTEQSCPYLAGKPKLFFIQSYVVCDAEQQCAPFMVDASGFGQPIAPSDKKLKCSDKIQQEPHVFWNHCKVEEKKLQHFPSEGSLYLKSLCSVLIRPRKLHLLDTHTEVSSVLSGEEENECSLEMWHTLTKNLGCEIPAFSL